MKVPIVTAQTKIGGGPLAQPLPASVGAPVRKALEDIGTAFEKMEVRRDAADLLKARAAAGIELDALVDKMTAADANAEPGAWKTAPDRFKRDTEQLEERFASSLRNPDMQDTFRMTFQEARSKAARQVAVHGRKQETDEYVANLDAFSASQLTKSYSAASQEDADLALMEAAAAIRAGQKLGYITAVEAGKRERGLWVGADEARVAASIRTNPEEAIGTLLDPGAYGALQGEVRERWLRTARSQADAAQRDRVEAARRADVEAERGLKRAQVQTEAQLIGRLSGNGPPVSEQELSDLASRQRISDEGWRMLRGELRSSREGVDNPEVVADTVRRMVRDDADVYGDLLRARERGQVSRETFTSLIEKNQAAITQRQRDPYRTAEQKTYLDFVDRFMTGGKAAFDLDDDTRQRTAFALREYQERAVFGNETPKVVADDVVAKYAAEIKVIPRSTYFDAPQSQADVKAAGDRLRTLRAGGMITTEAYENAMRSLREAAEALPPPAAPAGKGKAPAVPMGRGR